MIRRILIATAAVLALLLPPAPPASAIVNGTPATITEWPSIVAVIFHGQANAQRGQFCGGTVIAPRVVLTAAHCALEGGAMDVVARRDTLTSAGGERVRVTRTLVNPTYREEGKGNSGLDVGLLFLAHALKAPPIRLATSRTPIPSGAVARVAGWGLASNESHESSDRLLQATLRTVSDTTCVGLYGSEYGANTELCAGVLPSSERDPCAYDSGGPLVLETPRGPVEFGIVSWGANPSPEYAAGCAVPGYPTVFARVAPAYRWIHHYITR